MELFHFLTQRKKERQKKVKKEKIKRGSLGGCGEEFSDSKESLPELISPGFPVRTHLPQTALMQRLATVQGLSPVVLSRDTNERCCAEN